ncbi:hypothetical protein JTB14_032947 [Gonioctena quinquepunctata]|nr:hypothetical protein JTB14_032947 [Gonioctena quinquepunctata]
MQKIIIREKLVYRIKQHITQTIKKQEQEARTITIDKESMDYFRSVLQYIDRYCEFEKWYGSSCDSIDYRHFISQLPRHQRISEYEITYKTNLYLEVASYIQKIYLKQSQIDIKVIKEFGDRIQTVLDIYGEFAPEIQDVFFAEYNNKLKEQSEPLTGEPAEETTRTKRDKSPGAGAGIGEVAGSVPRTYSMGAQPLPLSQPPGEKEKLPIPPTEESAEDHINYGEGYDVSSPSQSCHSSLISLDEVTGDDIEQMKKEYGPVTVAVRKSEQNAELEVIREETNSIKNVSESIKEKDPIKVNPEKEDFISMEVDQGGEAGSVPRIYSMGAQPPPSNLPLDKEHINVEENKNEQEKLMKSDKNKKAPAVIYANVIIQTDGPSEYTSSSEEEVNLRDLSMEKKEIQIKRNIKRRKTSKSIEEEKLDQDIRKDNLEKLERENTPRKKREPPKKVEKQKATFEKKIYERSGKSGSKYPGLPYLGVCQITKEAENRVSTLSGFISRLE